MSKMPPPYRPKSARLDMSANYEPAFRLLGAFSFELSLGTGFTWEQPSQARDVLGADIPSTLLEFIDRFEMMTPRLSVASLSALLPGAQRRWEAQLSGRGGRILYFEIIFERASQDDETFIGVMRDITDAHMENERVREQSERAASLGSFSGSDFALQKDFLTKLSHSFCPQAAFISFTLKGRERVEKLYGAQVNSHIDFEILRRLIAFMPQTAIIARDDAALMCLMPDIEMIDAESLSQALTAFPISTADGPISIELDVNIQILAELSAKKQDRVPAAYARDETPITEDDIIALLNQRSLSLALQPICEAPSGKVHHYEALMRVDDPVKGPQSAWRHILRAEELGLVHLLDQRALERAALLMIRYPDLHLALNVSAGTVGDAKKQDDYLDQLDAYPALHSRLGFEMTETMALEQSSLAAQFAARLKSRGCYLSIDDFGAGHTSFETLMITEARQIKLDGSLIEGVCSSADKQNFVRLMVDFAQTFNVKLVAERIETVQEQRLLTAIGVDYLQGYFLGKPVSEHDFKGTGLMI